MSEEKMKAYLLTPDVMQSTVRYLKSLALGYPVSISRDLLVEQLSSAQLVDYEVKEETEEEAEEDAGNAE